MAHIVNIKGFVNKTRIIRTIPFEILYGWNGNQNINTWEGVCALPKNKLGKNVTKNQICVGVSRKNMSGRGQKYMWGGWQKMWGRWGTMKICVGGVSGFLHSAALLVSQTVAPITWTFVPPNIPKNTVPLKSWVPELSNGISEFPQTPLLNAHVSRSCSPNFGQWARLSNGMVLTLSSRIMIWYLYNDRVAQSWII